VGDGDPEGLAVGVLEGDHVEVLALAGDPIDDLDHVQTGRFVRSVPLPAAMAAGYRASGARRAMRVGDKEGTRLVLRVLPDSPRLTR
jgi:hypothetical protein